MKPIRYEMKRYRSNGASIKFPSSLADFIWNCKAVLRDFEMNDFYDITCISTTTTAPSPHH